MESNLFWPLVEELYPLFLIVILFYGVIRMAKASLAKIRGEDEAITQALSAILEGFFWAHITLPLLYAVWLFFSSLATRIEPIIKMLGE